MGVSMNHNVCFNFLAVASSFGQAGLPQQVVPQQVVPQQVVPQVPGSIPTADGYVYHSQSVGKGFLKVLGKPW